MCEIVGGIYVIGTDQINTVIYGGNAVVVGKRALDAMQDRILYTQGDIEVFKSLDNKKLLGFIGMSQPISFGTVDSDDGATSFIVSRSSTRATPSEKLVDELKARLCLSQDKVVELLIQDLKLNQAVWLALGNAVDSMIKQMDASLKSRWKKPLDIIMIAPALGHLIPFSHVGKLEVATDVKESDPKSFKELMVLLLDLAIKTKCIAQPRDSAASPSLPVVPEYPTPNVSLATVKSSGHESVADYVTAIITRENELTPHLVAIEKYNVEVAHGIQEFAKHIMTYFAN